MKKTLVRNPIYGFDSQSIEEKIISGQIDEIDYVDGEGVVQVNKKSPLNVSTDFGNKRENKSFPKNI